MCGGRELRKGEAKGEIRGLAVLGTLGTGQLGHMSLSPALSSQLPQVGPLPQVGSNQNVLGQFQDKSNDAVLPWPQDSP